MLNVLIPLGGQSPFFPREEYYYPKNLIDIQGRPMIQHVIENLKSLAEDIRFTFVVTKEDCETFHLDKVLRLLCGDDAGIIVLDGETKGAACSCLLAIEMIGEDEPLVIANADQILEMNLADALDSFRSRRADAGLVVFDAIHPRWSFARLEDEDRVVETGEKRPISKNAIAGFYYFAKAGDFFKAAMLSIKRDAPINGSFYVSPVFNELVLCGKVVFAYRIENDRYYSLYTPQKMAEYEAHLMKKASMEAKS